MPSPTTALLWFVAISALVAIVVWPRHGLWARIARLRRLSDRVRIEDALKHILNCELAGHSASVASMAGILEINPGKAHELTERVTALGLAESNEKGIALTSEGRAYALRILRTHRLLERYFADRTGAPPDEWHALAERDEHALTEPEVEALAARMGHPVYDPHGDPIPTATGDLPPPIGVPLAALGAGETARVVHVEDEPTSVYHRLRSMGIDVTVPVKMGRVEPNSVEVLVGGATCRLDPLVAAAVTVERVEERASHTERFDRLDSLKVGETAYVVQISPQVQGPQRRRLLDLGVLPGTEVHAEMKSPSGDPMAFRIRGALIALRKPQAQGIYVRRTPDPVEVAT